jgi:uncharacterized membrane protein YwzB
MGEIIGSALVLLVVVVFLVLVWRADQAVNKLQAIEAQIKKTNLLLAQIGSSSGIPGPTREGGKNDGRKG